MKQSLLKTTIGRLRLVGMLEGISFLFLLGIAMPLKYFANMAIAVKYTGWVHGALFVLYVSAIAQTAFEKKWSIKKILIAFIAAFLPFGPFILDKKLAVEDKAEEIFEKI